MSSHIALLRGINVGARTKVPMADLREIMTALGHTAVATYIQSGNVVFTPGVPAEPTALAAPIEDAVVARLGFRPAVVVLTRDDLAGVLRDNPYPQVSEPKQLHAIFLADEPGPDAVAGVADAQRVAVAKGSRDTAVLHGRTLYLHTPDGMGRSVLAEQLSRARRPGAVGTARNWATVATLLALCDE